MTSPRNPTHGRADGAAVDTVAPEPADDSVWFAAEVISDLEIANTLTHLEARLDSIEIDIARIAGARDDDGRRVAGEMAVMKARVEDALNAVTETAEDLRGAWMDLDKRLVDRFESRLADQQRALEELRKQLAASIEAGRVSVEQSEARLQGEIEALASTSLDRAAGATALIEEARERAAATFAEMESKLTAMLAEVEGRAAEVLASARIASEKAENAARDAASGVREDAAARDRATADRFAELTRAVEALTARIEAAEARRAGERVSVDVGVQSLSADVSALEGRVRDSLEVLSGEANARVEGIAASVSELRQAILHVATAAGGAAFSSRRLADLELKVAEVAARLDRVAERKATQPD